MQCCLNEHHKENDEFNRLVDKLFLSAREFHSYIVEAGKDIRALDSLMSPEISDLGLEDLDVAQNTQILFGIMFGVKQGATLALR